MTPVACPPPPPWPPGGLASPLPDLAWRPLDLEADKVKEFDGVEDDDDEVRRCLLAPRRTRPPRPPEGRTQCQRCRRRRGGGGQCMPQASARDGQIHSPRLCPRVGVPDTAPRPGKPKRKATTVARSDAAAPGDCWVRLISPSYVRRDREMGVNEKERRRAFLSSYIRYTNTYSHTGVTPIGLGQVNVPRHQSMLARAVLDMLDPLK